MEVERASRRKRRGTGGGPRCQCGNTDLELSAWRSASERTAIEPTHTFRRDLGAGDWVSGPQLTYHHGETTRKYEVEVSSEEGFDAKRMADGRIMIKEGPEAIKPYGRQIEGCPSMKLEIWALDSNLNLITLLNLGAFLCGGGSMPSSGDFTVSPDWSQVTEYLQAGPDNATSPGHRLPIALRVDSTRRAAGKTM